jgi:hypothetical protein
MIDYTQPTKTYKVSTTVVRAGVAYMGPDIKVNARDAKHAEAVAREKGHEPNKHFPPEEVKG